MIVDMLNLYESLDFPPFVLPDCLKTENYDVSWGEVKQGEIKWINPWTICWTISDCWTVFNDGNTISYTVTISDSNSTNTDNTENAFSWTI